MDELELLGWQFRIGRMSRAELEGVLADMDAEDRRRYGTLAAMSAQAKRAAVISNVNSMMSRPAHAPAVGERDGDRPQRTATIDLGEYYAAVETEQAEAKERAERDEVRAMCERRLAHFDLRDELAYTPADSPLKSYIASLVGPHGDEGSERP